MFLDDLLQSHEITQKHKDFIQIFYFERVTDVVKAKERWYSERTFYRRKREVHTIIEKKWQESKELYLQPEPKKNRVLIKFTSF